MSIKKVVVTGGSGRVGTYVLRELLPHFDVTNADLVEGRVDTQYVRADVMDLDSLRRAFVGADAVVHLAAIDFDWKAAPEKYIDVNVRGTWHVLQAASEAGVKKVVLCSSVSACGLSEMRSDWHPQYLQVDEQHECRPVQAYSVSKQLMEQMGLSFVHGTAMDVICLRPLAVIMQETFAEYVKFVEEPNRNWLFYYVTATDVARGFRAALDVKGVRYGTFFLSAADTSRPEPTVEWYRHLFGDVPPLKNPEWFKAQPRASVFSSAKAKDMLGWEPASNYLDLRALWL
ncbi:MAG TPA: NAD(P)-dependent oxidoreductase [Rhodoferax sp.]|nr:NAD(P)-dependent oxidoreductase [Rhodoferax sp.]